MSQIVVESFIAAPIATVFDLSRSIDLHVISTGKTNEQAIEGVTSGLINEGEYVTWKAYHLFKTRYFTSKITDMQPPFYFRDEMVNGDFKKFYHEHFFEIHESGTLMRDLIFLQSPYGLIGRLADAVYLKQYITGFLLERNAVIKRYAESGSWKQILHNT